jgi:hypothetical protein
MSLSLKFDRSSFGVYNGDSYPYHFHLKQPEVPHIEDLGTSRMRVHHTEGNYILSIRSDISMGIAVWMLIGTMFE